MKQIIIRPNGTKQVRTINTLPSKTDQQFQKEVDVNTIIARFRKTGHISHLAKNQGAYLDVSEIPDLLTATMQVQLAQNSFETLPAAIRKKFSDSPIEFYNFMHDEKNREEAQKLGLIPQTLPEQKIPDETKTKNAEKNKKPKQNQNDDSNDE